MRKLTRWGVGLAIVCSAGIAGLFVADGRHRGWLAAPALFSEPKRHWYDSQSGALYVRQDTRCCRLLLDPWRNALLVVSPVNGEPRPFAVSRRGERARLACNGGPVLDAAHVNDTMFVAAADGSVLRFTAQSGAVQAIVQSLRAEGRDDIRATLLACISPADELGLRDALYGEHDDAGAQLQPERVPSADGPEGE